MMLLMALGGGVVVYFVMQKKQRNPSLIPIWTMKMRMTRTTSEIFYGQSF
ncbi:MAG: hypothetical protein ACLR4A_05850 [Christensenellales bacterium]